MTPCTDTHLLPYIRLTAFLGEALGPDVEVVLHDMRDASRSVVAIANGHISGREIGAPLTNVALEVVHGRGYETEDYRVHDYGWAANGKELRSNTFYIKEDGELIGMLCVNIDDSRYREVADRIMGLIHPQSFVSMLREQMPDTQPLKLSKHTVPVQYSASSEAVAQAAVARELERLNVTAERMTVEERLEVISVLETQGVFLLKGVVKDVAAALHCSQASVYRYLSQIRDGAESEQHRGEHHGAE